MVGKSAGGGVGSVAGDVGSGSGSYSSDSTVGVGYGVGSEADVGSGV